MRTSSQLRIDNHPISARCPPPKNLGVRPRQKQSSKAQQKKTPFGRMKSKSFQSNTYLLALAKLELDRGPAPMHNYCKNMIARPNPSLFACPACGIAILDGFNSRNTAFTDGGKPWAGLLLVKSQNCCPRVHYGTQPFLVLFWRGTPASCSENGNVRIAFELFNVGFDHFAILSQQ